MKAFQKMRLVNVALFALAITTVILVAGEQAGAIPRLDTTVLGSAKLLANSKSCLRVLCKDHMSGKALPGAYVSIALSAGDKEYALFEGKTGKNGLLDASFDAPDLPAGSYLVNVKVNGLGETDKVSAGVTMARPMGILVATDKPLYQPGQLIHIRALALWTGTRKPAGNTATTLEVEDAKGNKVFKQIGKTNTFGIFSSDFQLADEINLGHYKIRALIGDSTEEKTVTVDKYVLPKFKINLTTDREFYSPSATMSGSLGVDYIFGKPVTGGNIEVTLSAFDVGFTQFATLTGKTDAQGQYKFEQKLPDHFVGQPLEQGNALIKVDVKVTDTAEHEQTMTRMLPVAGSGMVLSLIPERPTALRNGDLQVYAMASTPDGRPVANAQLWFGLPDGRQSRSIWTTDDSGLATMTVPHTMFPKAASSPNDYQPPFQLVVSGKNANGDIATGRVPINFDAADEGIILRPYRSLVKAGTPLYCEAIVTGPNPTGTVYFDIVKDDRTVLTKSADSVNGRAEILFSPTEDLAGTIRIHAYRLTYQGNIVRDTRIVFVSPSSDLSVKLTLDRATYRPGEKAKLLMQVGRKGASAVGLSVVDESVFALQEMQPGMERVYFMLEQELLHPKYEIHSITPGQMFQPAAYTKSTQLAARAMFAQAKPVEALGIVQNTYRAKLEPFMKDWTQAAQSAASAAIEAAKKWHDNVHYTPPKGQEWLLQSHYPVTAADWKTCIDNGWLKEKDITDPWGKQYKFHAMPAYQWRSGKNEPFGSYGVIVQSAGIDGRFDSNDDFGAQGYFQGNGAVYALGAQFDSSGIVQQFGFNARLGRAGGFGGRGVRGGFAMDDADGMVVERAIAPGAAGPMGMGGAGKMREMLKGADMEEAKDKSSSKQDAGGEPRMRQYFPETLYWNPSVITDENGKATVEIPLADSITTWRVSAGAVSANGDMGSATAPLKVFQDFFVDIDLPVALTQNDEVSVPVAIYNYLQTNQKVTLTMEATPGMQFLGDTSQTTTIGPNDVRAIYFRFKVTGLGRQTLTVKAKGDRLSDAMMREIDVVPDGRKVQFGVSDRLSGDVDKTVEIPDCAIDGASSLVVKVYPGVMATMVEGLDKILQMPCGCFEQTSSSTYPNVMVLKYMKDTRQVTPEIQMKAEQYINLGYQRLLSFEVRGGGFEWFGNAPANQVLTSYGLLEFTDMAKVYGIDPAVITRTQAWLEKQQQPDGSWKPDQGGIDEGATQNKHDTFRTTAYVAWALGESGLKSGSLAKAHAWLAQYVGEQTDPYALALAANAFLGGGDRVHGDQAIEMLLAKAKREKDTVYFGAEGPTAVYGYGKSGNIETTAITVLALLKAGGHTETINKAISYLIANKDPNGVWYTTQATIFALKALVSAVSEAGKDMNGEGKVIVNGTTVGTFVIKPSDYEVVRQLDAKNLVQKGQNTVRIEYSGKGGPMFQIAGTYYVPWDRKATDTKPEMDINVEYDKTHLEANDTVTCKVRVVYQGKGEAANMVIVDLGVPPGFDVLAGDLAELVGSKVIQKFNLTPRQAILYFDSLKRDAPVTFSYRLKARYPLRARTPASRVYEYYNPDNVSYSPPELLEVGKK